MGIGRYYLSTQPFYLNYYGEVKATSFKTVSINEKSINLFKKGKNLQAYAFRAWYKNKKWHLRLRPGFNNPSPPELKEAKELFGDDIVISDGINFGIVHKTLELQVLKDEPMLAMTDERNPQIYQCAGSVYKLSPTKYLWINRSVVNMNLSNKNELALLCYTFTNDQTNFVKPFQLLSFLLSRSLDKEALTYLAKTATKILGGTEVIFEELEHLKFACSSFPIVDEWNEIAKMPETPEKNAIIHNKLMRTLYIAVGIENDETNQNPYLSLITDILNTAKREKIKLDLEWVPPPFDSTQPAILMAAKRGYKEVIKHLIQHGAKAEYINEEGESTSKFAFEYAFHKKIPIIEKLLDEKLNLSKPSARGLTPIYIATRLKNHKLLTKLLIVGNDPNIVCSDETPLICAIRQSDRPSIELLLSHKADPNLANSWGLNSFHWALKKDDSVLASKLIEYKARVNQRDNKDHLPIYTAILRNQLSFIDLLLKENTDLNILSEGTSPLSLAVNQGEHKIISKLLFKGANPNLPTKDGLYPLETAIKNSDERTTKKLIEYKANLNIKITAGSLLHLAIIQKDYLMIKYLLNKGIALDILNIAGETPLRLAMRIEDTYSINFILKHLKIEADFFFDRYRFLKKIQQALISGIERYSSPDNLHLTELLTKLQTAISESNFIFIDFTDGFDPSKAFNYLFKLMQEIADNPITAKHNERQFFTSGSFSLFLKNILKDIEKIPTQYLQKQTVLKNS